MPQTVLYPFLSVLLISAISLVGALAVSVNERRLRGCVFVLVALATGALLGDAFIHLIPEAFEKNKSDISVSLFVVAGIFLFFLLEKALKWRHAHADEHVMEDAMRGAHAGALQEKSRPLGRLILASDGLHNFLDGVIIGVSFSVSAEIGIASTIAIILHEIPQELGDFGVLLHAGYSKGQALWYNFFSALFAVLGVIVVFALGERADAIVPWILPVAAGSFIYIANADLVPELQKQRGTRATVFQIASIALGILAMYVLVFFE